MSRSISKSDLQSLDSIAFILSEQQLGWLLEVLKHLLIHIVQLLENVFVSGLLDIFIVWDLDPLKLDSGLLFDPLEILLASLVEEGDASSIPSSSGSSARSMDVRLSVLRRLELDDELNVGDVKTSGGNVCGDEDLDLVLFESLHGDFSLVLRDVAMHALRGLLNGVRSYDVVGIDLCLSEDNDTFGATVNRENLGESFKSLVERTKDCKMLHIHVGSVV